MSAEVPRLALICAVAQELAPLLSRLSGPEPLQVGHRTAYAASLAGVPVLALAGGMGKVNAAQCVTALLERGLAQRVIGFGVGGAYIGAGLGVGGVALASGESYGDEGVQTARGWLSTEQIGIALLERGELRCFNHFPLDADEVARARAALGAGGVTAVVGPFVTVSCCSGTAARGAELAARFGAVCENMEGAALAHVCALYGVPFLEVRGISNLVEDRDLARWRLREATEAAARAVVAMLPSSPDPES
mgnify:CR=1 FL=1